MSITTGEAKKRIQATLGRGGVSVTDAELLAAINDAIDDCAESMPYDVAPDESITLVADTYGYSIASVPADLIQYVSMADSDGHFPEYQAIPRHLWWIVQGSTPMLTFSELGWSPTAGRKLRIEGQKFQDVVTVDAGVIYAYAPFIVKRAAATLVGNLGNLDREKLLLAEAEDARSRSPLRPRPNSRKVYR
jgi:hypothetical protein